MTVILLTNLEYLIKRTLIVRDRHQCSLPRQRWVEISESGSILNGASDLISCCDRLTNSKVSQFACNHNRNLAFEFGICFVERKKSLIKHIVKFDNFEWSASKCLEWRVHNLLVGICLYFSRLPVLTFTIIKKNVFNKFFQTLMCYK